MRGEFRYEAIYAFLYDMLNTAKEKIHDVCGGSKRKYMSY